MSVITEPEVVAAARPDAIGDASRRRERDASGADLTFQLNQIVAQICRVMDAEGCTVYLYDEATDEIWSRVLSSTHSKEIRLRLGEGIAGQVMATGESLNIRDAQQDARHASRYDESGFVTRSVLCQPLVSPDGCRVGVVQVLNKRAADGFSPADEQLLEALNSQVAIALENARLCSDLSASRAVERRLAAELESKHRELQDSYQRLESTNDELKTNLRRIQLLRLAAVVGGVVLFAAVGLLSVRGSTFARTSTVATIVNDDASSAAGPERLQTLLVAPQQTRASLPLQTHVEPLRTVNVVAGLDGTIAALHFRYGQPVVEGEILLEVDTTSETILLRDATVAAIRARDKRRELERWRSGPVVAEARRALTRAERAQRGAERRATETERLFGKGIVGRDELDGVVGEVEAATMDAIAARDALARALAAGDDDNVRIAEMEHANAQAAVATIEARIANATIRAPFDGVVLLVEAGGEASTERRELEVGDKVTAGTALLAIGDLSGLTLRGRLDETEITSVRVGHKVEVTSLAVDGLALEGTVVGRASQGRWDAIGGGYRFDVVATVDTLPSGWADRVLLGMSATMDIIIRDTDDAILVPLEAVHLDDGEAWVEVVAATTGVRERRAVSVGMTTIDAVEVVAGLSAGEEIVLR